MLWPAPGEHDDGQAGGPEVATAQQLFALRHFKVIQSYAFS
jgi:hypothetical protein